MTTFAPHIRPSAAIIAVTLLACAPTTADTESDTGGTSGGTDSDTDGGAHSEILVGTFQVTLVAPTPATGETPASPGKTTVLGKIYDGPVPEQVIWEEAATAGDCTLLTPRIPLCSTPCGGSAVCVEDETCQDYPTAQSAGTITVKGVKSSSGDSFTMEPIANTYQPAGGVTLEYPAFAAGDEITLAAAGDAVGKFSLSARGIEQLALADVDIELAADQPVTLAWTPAADPELSTIHVKLDISHHGGTKGMITCETADTGSLELGADLVTQLLALGVAGFPSIIVTRENFGATDIAAGRVDLVVSSRVERFVGVDGLTSCSDDSQCPDGLTCQADLTCA